MWVLIDEQDRIFHGNVENGKLPIGFQAFPKKHIQDWFFHPIEKSKQAFQGTIFWDYSSATNVKKELENIGIVVIETDIRSHWFKDFLQKAP